MERAMILAAFCGLTAGVSAQTLRVDLIFDRTTIAIGETTTASLIASFTGQPAGSYVSNVNMDLYASEDIVLVSDVAPIVWNNPGLGYDGQGTASGSDVIGLQASQFSLIPPITGGSPLLITTFTVTGVAEGTMTYIGGLADGAMYPFHVTGGAFSDPVVYYDLDDYRSESLTVTPSPGVLGVVGACGLLATRRRR